MPVSFAKTGVVQRLAESDLLMASAAMKVGNRTHPAFAFDTAPTRLVCVDCASHAETGALS